MKIFAIVIVLALMGAIAPASAFDAATFFSDSSPH
jgi:hypothetical protein